MGLLNVPLTAPLPSKIAQEHSTGSESADATSSPKKEARKEGKMQCQYCFKYNHVAADCRKLKHDLLFCNNCHLRGHEAATCRRQGQASAQTPENDTNASGDQNENSKRNSSGNPKYRESPMPLVRQAKLDAKKKISDIINLDKRPRKANSHCIADNTTNAASARSPNAQEGCRDGEENMHLNANSEPHTTQKLIRRDSSPCSICTNPDVVQPQPDGTADYRHKTGARVSNITESLEDDTQHENNITNDGSPAFKMRHPHSKRDIHTASSKPSNVHALAGTSQSSSMKPDTQAPVSDSANESPSETALARDKDIYENNSTHHEQTARQLLFDNPISSKQPKNTAAHTALAKYSAAKARPPKDKPPWICSENPLFDGLTIVRNHPFKFNDNLVFAMTASPHLKSEILGHRINSVPFTIERLDTFTGPLIENLGPTAISISSWKTLQKVNIADILNAPTSLQEILSRIKYLCNNTCPYTTRLKMSEVQLIEATKTVENLRLTLNQHSSDRHKRSLAPVIGRVANLLFGTLDDLAEERIMGLIETSMNDTRKLAELLANQTEIVDKRLQYTEEEMRTLKKNIESALDERWNYLDLIDTLTSQIVYARIDAGILTEAILFARQGILHPQLIPSTLINSASDLIKIVKTNPNIEADLETRVYSTHY
uniref:CCHC-type domain-containing protein n=1 Tax=Trichogramma kaykai TaxID=54128 RepID=A0ABD2WAK5_9HYME